MVYGTYNYSIHGVYKPTYNWRAPPCRLSSNFIQPLKELLPSHHLHVGHFQGMSNVPPGHGYLHQKYGETEMTTTGDIQLCIYTHIYIYMYM